MADLRRNLGLIEAVALSLSIIAPTMAMAFNVSLAVGAAGRAAPLAFLAGTVALAVVGLSFVAFARKFAHAGSAYAFISSEFGPHAGFIAGWALMLTYICYCTATAVLAGNFIDAALANYGITIPGLWVLVSLATIAMATLLAYRDMRLAARLMLALEAASVLAIIVLGIIVLHKSAAIGASRSFSLAPDPAHGWSGVGYAMVFAVLSFAGFEGAATLGEETGNPNRAIPIAVLGTVILAGIFYTFASYIQVVGFGPANMATLASDAAPLNTLALRFGSHNFATFMDLAAAISAFSCALGSMSAAARMLFTLGRAGLLSRVSIVHQQHGTPGNAVLAIAAIAATGILLCAPFTGATGYYSAMGTIGTLALILVYMAVTIAQAVDAARSRKTLWAAFGILGTLILLWPLYNSIYPAPAYPGYLWPYVVLIYLASGIGLLVLRPAIGKASWRTPAWNRAELDKQPEEG